MREIHLRQPGFTYSACGPFTKTKERIIRFKETGDLRCIYNQVKFAFNMLWLMQILMT